MKDGSSASKRQKVTVRKERKHQQVGRDLGGRWWSTSGPPETRDTNINEGTERYEIGHQSPDRKYSVIKRLIMGSEEHVKVNSWICLRVCSPTGDEPVLHSLIRSEGTGPQVPALWSRTCSRLRYPHITSSNGLHVPQHHSAPEALLPRLTCPPTAPQPRGPGTTGHDPRGLGLLLQRTPSFPCRPAASSWNPKGRSPSAPRPLWG